MRNLTCALAIPDFLLTLRVQDWFSLLIRDDGQLVTPLPPNQEEAIYSPIDHYLSVKRYKRKNQGSENPHKKRRINLNGSPRRSALRVVTRKSHYSGDTCFRVRDLQPKLGTE